MYKILMIDDDLDDQYFYKDLFLKYSEVIEFDSVSGQDELNAKFLNIEAGTTEIPSLILLDLNLPKVSGKQIFEGLKKNELFKGVPVVVLTTSSSPIDMEDCKSLGIESYFVKPVEYHECENLVQTIYAYWFDYNALNEI